MDRVKWTDERLDREFAAMDKKRDDLRDEMRAGFARIDAALDGLRAEFTASHRQLLYIVVSLWLGVLGLFGTLVAKL